MSRARIGGELDLHALSVLAGHVTDGEYRERADAHRPDADGLRSEALRMWHAGLTARDISVALRLAEPMVQEWIAQASA